MLVVDALREIKTAVRPESVVEEFAALLKTYRVSKITGDRYAGEWPRERFRKHGISYEPAQQNQSQISIGTCCPPQPRRTRAARPPAADHSAGAGWSGGPRAAAATASTTPRTRTTTWRTRSPGCAGLAGTRRYRYDSSLSWVSDSDDDFQRQRLSQHILHFGGFYRQRR